MSRSNQIGSHKTTISSDADNRLIVTYHSTQVVKRANNGAITLNSGGDRSNTTKNRMNQAANQYSLGYQVFQRKFEWFVKYLSQDNIIPFTDGMVLHYK